MDNTDKKLKLTIYNKTYYQNNKEKLDKKHNTSRKEIITRCCGKDITRGNYYKHLKAKEHRRWLDCKYKLIHRELLEKFK